MKTIYPKKIKDGDTLCVISPSSSAKTFQKSRLDNSIKNVKKVLGLNTVWSKNAFEFNKATQSSSIKSRIDDLHNAFKDKNINIISCARGGFNINDLLPYIDWNIVKNNPKIICGYSDITALANAIYTKIGIVTYIGPNFSTFGIQKQSNYTFDFFKQCVMTTNPIQIIPSLKWGQKDGEKFNNKGFQVLQKGHVQGIVVGGNLCTLNLLQGTEYMPNLKDKVLFIEEDDYSKELTPLEFERNLESLLQSCNRQKIKGILIGRFQKTSNMTFEKLKEIINRRNLPKTIPIISNIDFGHTMPMITIPVGGEIEISTNKKVEIIITKH